MSIKADNMRKARGCGFGGHTGQGLFCEKCGKPVGLPIILRKSELEKLEKKATVWDSIVAFGLLFVIGWVIWEVVATAVAP